MKHLVMSFAVKAYQYKHSSLQKKKRKRALPHGLVLLFPIPPSLSFRVLHHLFPLVYFTLPLSAFSGNGDPCSCLCLQLPRDSQPRLLRSPPPPSPTPSSPLSCPRLSKLVHEKILPISFSGSPSLTMVTQKLEF